MATSHWRFPANWGLPLVELAFHPDGSARLTVALGASLTRYAEVSPVQVDALRIAMESALGVALQAIPAPDALDG